MPQGLGQLARRLRGSDPQLVAQPLAQALVSPDRPGSVSSRRQPSHQIPLRLLGERVKRHLAAGVADRRLQILVPFG